VINNGGYTVERLIHGMHEAYNDVPLWEYSAMLKAFGPGVESKSYKISKSAELDALMSDEAFNNSPFTQV
jgi:pyruvate decarboxylase